MGGKWLSDNVVNAAQKLLKARHCSIGGLQNSLLVQNMQFQIERGRFVQILNVSSSHWITIVNVGCVQGEVHVYIVFGILTYPRQETANRCFDSNSNLQYHTHLSIGPKTTRF